MKKEEKHEVLIWGSVIGGVVVIWMLYPRQTHTTTTRARGIPQKQLSSHPSTMPNPAQATVDEAFAQARSNAIGMFDQTVLGEQSANDQLIATNNETQAQKVIAFNTNATQLKEAGLASTTMRDVAGTQASAEENIASQEASAIGQQEHAQQQQSLWGGILGIFQNIGSFFGFSQGVGGPFAPTGSGTGYVDSNTGDPISPYEYYNPSEQYTPQSWDYIPPIQVPQIQIPSNITIGG